MFLAALLQSAPDSDALAAALEALKSAFESGDVVLTIVAGVAIALVVVLKFLGRKIPLVDAGVKLVLGVVAKMRKPAPPPPGVSAVVQPVEDGKAKSSLGEVIQIKKDE